MCIFFFLSVCVIYCRRRAVARQAKIFASKAIFFYLTIRKYRFTLIFDLFPKCYDFCSGSTFFNTIVMKKNNIGAFQKQLWLEKRC
jgi:hypothetical protein